MTPEEIEEAAKAPKRMRNEEGSVEERSIEDIIKADVYQKNAQPAANRPPFGMSIARTKPPGTV